MKDEPTRSLKKSTERDFGFVEKSIFFEPGFPITGDVQASVISSSGS
jgi:hypothetical protein